MSDQYSVRPKEAAKLLGIGTATLWRWLNERPDFPRPMQLSARCTVFNAAALLKWRDSQVPGQSPPAQTRKQQSGIARMRDAAPDLLLATTALLDAVLTYGPEFMHGRPKKDLVRQAQTAINKATGDTSSSWPPVPPTREGTAS